MIPKKQHIVFSNIVLEFLLLNISILSVFFLKNFSGEIVSSHPIVFSELLIFVILFNTVWGFILLINRDQNFYLSSGNKKKIKSFILSTFMFIGIISTIAITFKIEYFNRTTFILPILLFSLLNIISFALVADILKRKSKAGYNSSVLLLGVGKKWNHTQHILDSLKEKGYEIVGFLDNHQKKSSIKELISLGKISDLESTLDLHLVDEIFIAGGSLTQKEIQEIAKIADYKGVRINIIPDTPVLPGSTLKPYMLDGLTLFQYRQTPLDNFSNFFLKRVFDIFFSLTVLIFLSPLFLLLGILIAMDRKGSILYTPLRKGESGNVFKC